MEAVIDWYDMHHTVNLYGTLIIPEKYTQHKTLNFETFS